MTTLITLNASVAEIEAALKAGKSVQDVAADLAEPPNNVYGVYRDLVARGVIEDGKRPGRPAQALRAVPTSPGAPVPGPVPPAPAAAPVAAGSAGPSHRAGRPKMDLPVERILRRLREHGSAERACREVGINSRTLTRHMKDDPELRRAVNVAREVGRRATFVHGAPGSSNRCRCDICKFTATTRKQKYVGPRKTGQPCDYCGRVVGRRRNGDVFAHHSEPGVVCPGSQSNNGSIRLAATS